MKVRRWWPLGLLIVVAIPTGLVISSRQTHQPDAGKPVKPSRKPITIPAGTLIDSQSFDFGRVNFYAHESAVLPLPRFELLSTLAVAVPRTGIKIESFEQGTVWWSKPMKTADGVFAVSYQTFLRNPNGYEKNLYGWNTAICIKSYRIKQVSPAPSG